MPFNSIAQTDTIAPVFTTPPQDEGLSCEEDIMLAFSNWYGTQAGAIADNGNAQVVAVLDISEATEAFENALTDCLGTGSFSLDFYAQDDAGNISEDTLAAFFEVFDLANPDIVLPSQNVDIFCDENSRDSLHSWIAAAGYAVVSDNCDTLPEWINYIWTDANGNNGFANFGDSIEIEIDRMTCPWWIDLTFFVEDDCGNINNSSARFTISGDNSAPQLISFPADTTILCNQLLPDEVPVFIDGCDGFLSPALNISSTQSEDSLSCEYYEYVITRDWLVSDACGNTASHRQIITVTDTLAPTADFESVIAKDCDEPLDDIDAFIDYSDNCGLKSISFQDSMTVSEQCMQQLERRYILQDFCDNTRTINQLVRVEDFSGPVFEKLPEDLIFTCSGGNLNLQFQNWISNFASAEVTDNCNSFNLLARDLPGLSDSTAILNAPTPSIGNIICTDGNVEDIVFEKDFFFYAYDACNNVTVETAQLILIDTLAPVIPNCPEDQTIYLLEDECDAQRTLSLPFTIDPCLSPDQIRWDVRIDEIFLFEDTNQSIDFRFGIGQHDLEYVIEDCASNASVCNQTIEVIDSFPPELLCPEDMEVYLPSDDCELTVDIPEIESFKDNCFGNADFSSTLPDAGGFIRFEQDPVDSSYSAGSFDIRFRNITSEERFFKPVLIIDYALNIDTRSRVVIKSEFGDQLLVLEKAPCIRQQERLVIDENQFEIWSLDEDINFAVSVEKNSDKGILPCQPDKLDGNEDIDEFSFLTITLEYTEVNPDFEIIDSFGVRIAENQQTVTLSQGIYDINYSTTDFAGNQGLCTSQIMVKDTTAPILSCSDQDFILNLDTEQLIDIAPEDLNISASDNCGIDRISYFPSDFSCQQIGREVRVVIQAWDFNDNFSFCFSNINVEGANLEPQFLSGLCLADTLKLFANVDNSINGDFSWTGPNSFQSNERNPIITNISEENSGRYQLELSTNNGCDFSGMVDIELASFLNPVLSVSKDSFCLGDTVRLTASSYSEEVIYSWYSGSEPDGQLLATTEIPELAIAAEMDRETFYILVEGEGCLSNPSPLIEILVLNQPTAEVDIPFISVCEGSALQLEASNIQQNLDYQWSGPNNYSSTGALPEPISDITGDNEGIYYLITDNGVCASMETPVQVFVEQTPPQPEIDYEDVYCVSEQVELSINNINDADIYRWYLNDNLYASTQVNVLVIDNINDDLNGDWYVTAGSGICTSDSSELINFNIESLPSIGASNNGPVCEGDSVRLTASFIPNASYQWLDPEGRLFFTREIQPLAVEGNYFVSVTSANGCQNSTRSFVEVGIKPEITALSNNARPCMMPGDTIRMNPSYFPPGNYTFNWTGPDGYTSEMERPELTGLDTITTGEYILEIILDHCSSEAMTTDINFNVTPEQAIIRGNTSLCPFEDLILTIENPSPHPDIQWLWSTPQGQITTDTPVLSLSNEDNDIAGNYSVIQNLNGCSSQRSNFLIVEIVEMPDQANIIGPSKACVGEEIILEAETEEADQYIWINPGQDSITTANNTLIIESLEAADSGSYFVFAINGDCLSEKSAAFNIEILELPLPPLFESNTLSVCPTIDGNLSICMIPHSELPDSLEWVIAADNNLSIITDGLCLDLSLESLDIRDDFEISAQSFRNGCISEQSDWISVQVLTPPLTSFGIDEERIVLCGDNEISLAPDIMTDSAQIVWSAQSDLVIINDPMSLVATLSNLTQGANPVFLNSFSEACGIYHTDSLNIFVIEDLIANDDRFTFDKDQSLVVPALINDIFSAPVRITISTETAIGPVELQQNQIIFRNDEKLSGIFEVDYTICYLECPELCDSASISINIIDSACTASNIITANGDGVNDLFKISCLEQNLYPENRLVIFNQWGDIVFEAAPYLNDWDGSYQRELLPSGTYFYILELGRNEATINGYIVLEK